MSSRGLTDHLPPHLAACLDIVRPTKWHPFGGPFNGQRGRQELVTNLLATMKPAAIIETGTNSGDTTAFLAEVSKADVYSVDINPRFYYFARMRLRLRPNIHLALDDSRQYIAKLARSGSFPRENVFFYLDAHISADLPLPAELLTINDHWSDWAALVDDFEVPGDAEYQFNDYGEFGRLVVSELPSKLLSNAALYFPTLPGATETGLKRGCVIIASGHRLTQLLASATWLRRYEF